jgi:hypothetical protein
MTAAALLKPSPLARCLFSGSRIALIGERFGATAAPGLGAADDHWCPGVERND